MRYARLLYLDAAEAGTGRLLFVVLALLLAAGCKATEPVAPPPPPPPPPINMAEYEDFDPAPYADAPPVAEAIQHDVPAALLDGTATSSETPQTVQGYRIQVFSAQDKQQADRRVERAMRWWRTQRGKGALEHVYPGHGAQPPVYLFFRQPYYRVRVGNFATRPEALRFLRLIERDFPDAFIVPDTVTLGR